MALTMFGSAFLIRIIRGNARRGLVGALIWSALVVVLLFTTWTIWNEPRDEIIGFFAMTVPLAAAMAAVGALGGWLRSRLRRPASQ